MFGTQADRDTRQNEQNEWAEPNSAPSSHRWQRDLEATEWVTKGFLVFLAIKTEPHALCLPT